MKKYFYLVLLFFNLNLAVGQNAKQFKGHSYPIELIDTNIVSKRNLETKIELLQSCDWKNKVGKKIDVFWLKTVRGNFFGHSYEYFMDCDNLRLIYWSTNGKDIFPIVDFMIEDLEEDSQFVSSAKKHLKNKKKYKKYLE